MLGTVRLIKKPLPRANRCSSKHVAQHSEGRYAALIVGFEASAGDSTEESVSLARERVEAEMREARTLLQKAGAIEAGTGHLNEKRAENSAAGKWGKSFMSGGYLFSAL